MSLLGYGIQEPHGVGPGAFQAEETESSKWGIWRELSAVDIALCGKVEERVETARGSGCIQQIMVL